MKVLVCINSEYVRDQQIYVGAALDDIRDEKEELNWQNASGAIIVAIKETGSVQTAIAETASFYGCSTDRFTGFRLDDNSELWIP